MNDTPLRRIADRVADLTLVGLLTIVATLPLVTGLAAQAAAVTTLTREDSGTLPVRYLRAFRSSLTGTVRPQLVILGGLLVGTGDLAVGWDRIGSWPSWLLAPVLACGVLLCGAALTLPPYLVALHRRGPQQPSLGLCAGPACWPAVTRADHSPS